MDRFAKHWNFFFCYALPWEMVDSPSLELLKKVCIWYVKTGFNGEQGGDDSLMVGLDDC